ncbi:MAG: hypothetical protein JSW35_00920 [Deltaproteobacteria bacterium]|nr:MAG: hypothetical protein JSW35_00920 [Deltaproteobacteria bacterium]
MPDIDPHDIEKALKAIQDIAIMLTGATEFVCEGGILKRFSRDIEANLQRLETHITSLKKKFPGKFPETLEPEHSLSRIRDIAKTLKGDNADMEAKCRSGDLGNELNTRAIELRGIVKNTLDILNGKVSAYTFTDRIADYGARIKSFLPGLSPFVSTTGRIILTTIVVAIFSFVYLFLTMESEDVLLASIRNDLAYIESQKDALRRQRHEYEEIRGAISPFQNKELSSEDKIQFLNLSNEQRKIKELIDKTTISIEKREKEIAEKNKKVEEIRKKSFLQKLLRR